MTSDTDTNPRDESPDKAPSDPLKIPDEYAGDEAQCEAFRDGFARALLLTQSTTSNFLRLATVGAGAESSSGREPPDTPADSSGLADLMDEIGGDDETDESNDEQPNYLGSDNT